MTRPLKVKRSKAQKEQLNSVRHGQLHAVPVSKPVSEPVSELQVTQVALSSTEEQLVKTLDQLHIAEEKTTDLYGTLRVERRKLQRTVASKKKLEKHIKLLQSVELPNAKGDAARAIQLLEQTRSENGHLQLKLSQLMDRCANAATQNEAKHSEFRSKLAASQKEKSKLQKCYNRFPEIKSKAVKRARDDANKENRTHSLLHKGTYSAESRHLARLLTKAGCSREYVGSVIQAVCQSAGITVKGKMSRRTVSRAILEGGIAAKIQLGYEVTQAKGIT
jgi:hypothetical protein